MRTDAGPVEMPTTFSDTGPTAAPPVRRSDDQTQAHGRAGGAALDHTSGPTIASVLRRLFGMPDYRRYLDHQARCHPDAPLLTEKEYVRSELERKYAGGGGRCC